jgi:methyl-accepting chemotaxis protein
VETIDARVQVLADHSAQLSDTAAANAATIEEITVSVTQIADNANEANALVRETGRMSEAGAAAIAEVSREFGRSADSVQQVAAMMQTLNNRAGEISGIVSVIREIADQTNLLALNAAIEAARAGEQGRGFAVVADEVRKLAERTGRATLEIGTMIQGMTGDTASAYASMEGSIQCVSQGARASEEAARQMHEIQTRMREAMQRLEDIASSTSEQQLATTQMAQAAEQITNRMHENDQALQAVRETLGMLGNVSRRLRELIGGFRL